MTWERGSSDSTPTGCARSGCPSVCMPPRANAFCGGVRLARSQIALFLGGHHADEPHGSRPLGHEAMLLIRSDEDRVSRLEGGLASIRSDRTTPLQDEHLVLVLVGVKRGAHPRLDVEYPQGEVGRSIEARNHLPNLHPFRSPGIRARLHLRVMFDDHGGLCRWQNTTLPVRETSAARSLARMCASVISLHSPCL